MERVAEILRIHPVAVLIGFLASVATLITFGVWLGSLVRGRREKRNMVSETGTRQLIRIGPQTIVSQTTARQLIRCVRCNGTGRYREFPIDMYPEQTCEVCRGRGVLEI
jgi:hypothetical protein